MIICTLTGLLHDNLYFRHDVSYQHYLNMQQQKMAAALAAVKAQQEQQLLLQQQQQAAAAAQKTQPQQQQAAPIRPQTQYERDGRVGLTIEDVLR